MIIYNGKKYARVSEVIQPFVNFGNIDPEILERKAALGSRVHDVIEQEIKGDLPIVGLQEQGYFKSFELWRSALQPAFMVTEKRIYCDQKMLTGCIDAVVKLHGENEAVLVDWKTSVSESPITWPMQAHLYFYLLGTAGIQVAPRFLFVKLDRFGGLPKVFAYKFDTKTMDLCFQAISTFWEQQKSKSLTTNGRKM